jgi:hypothetical protein
LKGKLKERVAQTVTMLGRIATILDAYGNRLDDLEELVNKLVDKELAIQAALKATEDLTDTPPRGT